MLEDLGCEVITAASGNDALEKLSGDRRIEILITLKVLDPKRPIREADIARGPSRANKRHLGPASRLANREEALSSAGSAAQILSMYRSPAARSSLINETGGISYYPLKR